MAFISYFELAVMHFVFGWLVFYVLPTFLYTLFFKSPTKKND